MISALYRYPKHERSRVASVWGRRSVVAKSAQRLQTGVDAETVRKRSLHDAKGRVERSGVTYRNGSEINWCVRRSLHGRTNQLDIVINGRLWQTCGPRIVVKLLRRSRVDK